MDTTLTSDATAPGTAETATPDSSSGTENAASENTQEQGGGEKSPAEGSQEQDQGQRKRWSIQDEVKELRAQRRELRERLSSFDEVRNELAQLRESMNRREDPKTAKTPANFWQDPEARFQALRDELAEQNKGLLNAFHRTREEEFQQQALRQEQASATEFIRSQKGYNPEDDEDLIEIIGAIPKQTRESASPQMIAEYAWMKLNTQRGIGDRSLAKKQAAGVQGQPPGVGFGQKKWTKAEFDSACDMLEKNPHDPKNAELLRELESAHKEGRVR